MKILIVGSGGREHALGWHLATHSPSGSHELFFAPGNPGTESIGKNVPLQVTDLESLRNFAAAEKIEMTVVGPEVPLSLGIVDLFQEEGLTIFGPSKAAAMVESSKQFAKEIMNAAGVPTGQHKYFTDEKSALTGLEQFTPPYVIKAEGLAAGKGVVVTEELPVAQEAITSHFETNSKDGILIEEFLAGREASFIVMTDGKRVVPLPASNDYKRIFDNDKGPNTGGMGTVSPTEHLAKNQHAVVLEKIIHPVLAELEKRDIQFIGFLYGGLMISPEGEIKVIEFNARMGDPEAQVLMRRWNGDLAATLFGLSTGGDLPEAEVQEESAAVCIVMASKGYPATSSKGDRIQGIAEAEALGDVVVFHAGTASEDGEVVTAGGRVLGVTALGSSVQDARLKAYDAVERISFPGSQHRKDIAAFS